MEKLFRSLGSGMAIFILILILFTLYIVVPPRPNYVIFYSRPIEDELLEDVPINDSLPHYEYRKIQDSIKRIIQEENKNTNSYGNGWIVFSTGVSSFDENPHPKYYLHLTGYSVTNSIRFYRWNGKDYLKTDYVSKETNLKIVQEKNKEDWTIFFPISKFSFQIINTLCIACFVLTISALLYLIYLFLKFLLLIAKGKAFVSQTIGILFTMGWFFIIAGLFAGIVKIIVHIIFKAQVPEVMHFSYYNAIMTGWGYIIAGLSTLLIAKAFLKGSELQEDQALTV